MALCLTCIVVFQVAVQPQGQAYPRPTLLIDAAELAKPDAAKKFRILDTRAAKALAAGRIPTALSIDVSDWSKRFTEIQDVKFWESELGRLGIDADVPVVVYGEDMRETARAWWIMRYWGVKDVRILNGGWAAWVAGKNPIKPTVAVATAIVPKQPKLLPAEQRLATMDQVKGSLKDKLLQIIDSRSEGEYCGDVKTAKNSGAIPGAIHLEWKELLKADSLTFKPAPELDQLFKKAGIDLTKPSVAHCQSGGRSSVMVFAMELMGAADARNYYRSWAEWGNAEGAPIEVPKKK